MRLNTCGLSSGTYANTTIFDTEGDGSWAPSHHGKFTSECHSMYHGECS